MAEKSLGRGPTPLNRVAMLTNPKAGRGKATRAARLAKEELLKYGIDIVDISGATPEHSRRMAGEVVNDPIIDALVVCGGDGLINLALQETVGTDTAVGIIPGGTGNDHARELNIPLDPTRAARVVAGGHTSVMDTGIMRTDGGESRYFGTVACAGFDSLVTDRANSIRWPTGRLRYNLAIVIEFVRFHSLPLRLYADGQLVYDDDATLVAVGNTKSYGGGMQITPLADRHDGLFDITVVGKVGRLTAIRKFGDFMEGKTDKHPEAHRFQAAAVRVELPGARSYADGEPFFDNPVTLEIVAQSARFLVPRP